MIGDEKIFYEPLIDTQAHDRLAFASRFVMIAQRLKKDYFNSMMNYI